MNTNLIIYILIYFVVVNLIAFLAMFIDKRKAINYQYRISEAKLIGIAAIGGALGTYIGMYTFRHKTKHTKFVLLVPILFIVNIILIFYVYNFLAPIIK